MRIVHISKTLWVLTVGALAGVSFAMAVDRIEPQAEAQASRQAEPEFVAAPSVVRKVPTGQQQIVLSYAPLVKSTAPAVVNVFTARVRQSRARDPFYDFFFGQGRMAPQPRVEQSLGSGVIVAGNGLVITNNHVVEGADEIIVALTDRREYPAKLLFTDKQMDLALLQVDTGGATLPTVAIGDSDRAEVGDVVVAIGNPFGVGQTVTHGIISALARTGVGISDYQFFIQTDAAINPGNSGGALLSMDGTLVGINTAIYSRSGGSNGIGFAIPANMVKQFIAGAKTGKITRAWMGFGAQGVTRDIARGVGLDRPAGVLVNSVTAGSPGDRAGLKVGDIILGVDGKDAVDPDALRYLIASKPVGGSVSMSVYRDGKTRALDMKLVAAPETPARDTTTLPGNHILAGVTVANLSPALSMELGNGMPDAGVVVMEIAGNAPAARLGFINPGDIIESVNKAQVTSVRGLVKQVENSEREMLIRLKRGSATRECYYRAPRSFSCRG